jgi:DNA-binding transcriptional regulator YiaG
MVKKKSASKGDGVAEAEPAKRPRRGGRKPGVWKLTNPDALREFRSTHKISRARLAGMLGVSSTSVQNWETGTVASMKIQQKLADIMKEGPAAFIPLKRGAGGGGWVGAQGPVNPTITTTGTIVTGFLQSQEEPLSQEELIGLIRSVRIALS